MTPPPLFSRFFRLPWGSCDRLTSISPFLSLPRSLSLTKGARDNRKAKLVCSPCLPERDAIFCITEQGVNDAKDS